MHSQVDSLMYILREGPATAAELSRLLAVSQPTLSRRIAQAGERIVRVGRARAVRYLARRTVSGKAVFPLYRVNADGTIEQWGGLLPVAPDGFVLRESGGEDRHLEGLPWWLQDMRPQGFLGRLWARHHAAALGLPEDLLAWTDDHVLAALAVGGHDVPGNLLVGDESRAAWLAQPPASISARARSRCYPRLAAQVAAGEDIGSSAGGEQPKFAAWVDGQGVLVKFSAAQDNAISQRWRDLLLAEHLALQLLSEHGLPAAPSDLLDANGQRFLQVSRFDRTSQGGRRGVVSLRALEAEYVGRTNAAWPQLTEALLAQHRITAQAHHDASRLYAFGRLIGNTDMHHGNLAFLHEGAMPLPLAPAYDMLPMALAPARSGDMRDGLPPFTLPGLPPADVWQDMLPLARSYWQRIAGHTLSSTAFARIAGQQQAWLDEAQRQLGRVVVGANGA